MQRATQDRTRLAKLRRKIAEMEGRLSSETQLVPAPASASKLQGPAGLSERHAKAGGHKRQEHLSRIPLDLPGAEALMPESGLLAGALHEIVAERGRDSGALSGFSLALLARVMAHRPGAVLWVSDPLSLREAGLPHGPGLARFGIDPARLITVMPRRLEDLLWAMEEGARCSALAAVVGEVQGSSKAVSLTATRRLALRAQDNCVPVLLIRHGVADEPTAAMTRWCVGPLTSQPPGVSWQGPHDLIGPALWRVDLNRNRDGRPGHLDLEWTHAACSFAAPARSVALVSGTGLRPDQPAREGRVVALPRRR